MPKRVVIAGGGIGALEGLLALQRLAPDRVRITLVTPVDHVAYRSLAVTEPFGAAPAPQFSWAEIARDRGVRWTQDAVTCVRADAREVEVSDGPAIRYDGLLLALGARAHEGLPGAFRFAGPPDVASLREALESLEPGRRNSIVFVAASGIAWTLPLYELALMTVAFGRRRGLDLAIELVTRESEPLGVFGRQASAAVADRLGRAGIRLRTGSFATEAADGRLWLDLEGPLHADLVVALPRLTGPRLAGVPHDADGFVPVDGYGRVRGVEHVWAVGDMTTRSLKQGGLAAQQADVAAADIAATVAGAPVAVPRYRPKLQGMLLTGERPLFLERRPHAPPESEATDAFLWWPPHKVAGRHTGAYLASLAARRPR
jgi:sulfide:quinone oxidoreductase